MADEKLVQQILQHQDPKKRLLTIKMIEHVLDTLAALPPEDGVNRESFGLEKCEPSQRYPDGVRGTAGDPDLSGFAGDMAVEVSRMMEDTEVRNVRITVEWEGTY